MSHIPDPRSHPLLNVYPGPAPVGGLPGQHIQVFIRPNGHTILPFATWARHGSLATEATLMEDPSTSNLPQAASRHRTQIQGVADLFFSPCVPDNAQISAQAWPQGMALAPHLDLAEGSLAHSCQPSSAGESPRDRLLSDGCALEQEAWPGATRSDQSYPLSTALSQLLLRDPV